MDFFRKVAQSVVDKVEETTNDISRSFPCPDYSKQNDECECKRCCDYDPGRRGLKIRKEENERLRSEVELARGLECVRVTVCARPLFGVSRLRAHHVGLRLEFSDGLHMFVEYEKASTAATSYVRNCDGKMTITVDQNKRYGTDNDSDWGDWGGAESVRGHYRNDILRWLYEQERRRKYLLLANDIFDVDTNCQTFAKYVLYILGAPEHQKKAIFCG